MAQGFKVRDPSLAGEGRMQIEWAERHMPVLMRLRSEMRGRGRCAVLGLRRASTSPRRRRCWLRL